MYGDFFRLRSQEKLSVHLETRPDRSRLEAKGIIKQAAPTTRKDATKQQKDRERRATVLDEHLAQKESTGHVNPWVKVDERATISEPTALEVMNNDPIRSEDLRELADEIFRGIDLNSSAFLDHEELSKVVDLVMPAIINSVSKESPKIPTQFHSYLPQPIPFLIARLRLNLNPRFLELIRSY